MRPQCDRAAVATLACLEGVSHGMRVSKTKNAGPTCQPEAPGQRCWRDTSVVVGSCADIVLRAVSIAAKQGPRCPLLVVNRGVVDVILPIVLGAIVYVGSEASSSMTYTVSDAGSALEPGNKSSLVG